jgi:WD40 repeat protein/tetratricopeptide (TPR) repeat protein
MSSPRDGPTGPVTGPAETSPDQTIGYESVRSSDVAESQKTSAHTPQELGLGQTPRSVFGHRTSPGRSSGISSLGKSLMTATGAKIAPETLVGPYEVIDELGTGGMGVVYKARHIHLNRTVALKMIIGGLNVGETHLERFRLEAEVVAKLNHPNIVQVYDVGEHNGVPYIALELVDGGNLSAKCDGKPQKHAYASQTVETLARAVHAAHQAGVIHRDLKPQNVLMTLDGQPKVTDFGLAKDIGGGSGQTHAGSIIGTPSYMAPEQAAGRIHDIGPATDVYALGCILYEMLVGHPPFRGESPIATIRLVLDGEPVSPKALQPHTPRDLDTICMKALQKPPHRRYASAAALAEDLRRHLDGEPITARPIGWPEWVWKWVKRNPARATAIGVFHVFLVIFVILAAWSYVEITNRARDAEDAHKSARKNLDESTRRMIRLNVANGTRLLDTYDYLGAPLWFAEALRLESEKLVEEPGFADRERMHRIRLRAVFDHCPRLSHVWLHEVALADAAYDASGRYAVTASEDGIARLWDTRDSQPVTAPMEHGAAVRAVALSPDARFVATGGADGFVRLWSAKDSRLLHTLNNGAALTRLKFSPDGAMLWSGCAAGRVRGWDTAAGREKSLFNFADRVSDLTMSLDGTKLAAASRDGSARVLDAATGLPLTPPLKHAAAVESVALSPDARRAVTGSQDRTATVWDTATGQPVFAPFKHPGTVHSVAIGPAGRRIVTACEDSTARVWDIETGQAVGRPVSHDGPVIFVTTGPDGRWAATAAEDNTIRIWDMNTGELVTPPLRNNALASAVRFSPNGHEILVADQTRAVRVWNLIGNGDLSGTTTIQKFASATPASAARDDMHTVFGRNGELSVTFGAGQAVRVRRSVDHEPLTPPLRSGAAISTAEFSPDAGLLVTGDLDGGVMAWSTSNGTAIWKTPAKHASKVLRAVFNPAGTAIITTSDDNTARIWNAADGSPVVPPVRLGAGVTVVEFGPDGKLFYTELANGRGRVWDANTGEPLTPPFPARKDWLASLIVAKWSVEEMLAAGRMLSGQQLSEAGDVLPTNAESLRDDWVLLRSRYDIVSKTPPAVLQAWRERQVKACLASEHWFGAGWHLDRLIAEQPENADFRRDRAAVSAKLGDWKRAAEGAKSAILLQPANPEHWYQRGVALGQLGDWRDAAAHINQAMQLKANPHAAAGLSAKVKLEAGDLAGYRKICRELADLHRDAANPAAARAAAWALALSPESGIEPGTLVKLAEAGSPHADTATHALALLRAGRADDAALKLKTLADAADASPVVLLVQSLALARTGQTDAALALRSKAAKWLSDHAAPGSTVPPGWDLRTDVEILLREAAAMK